MPMQDMNTLAAYNRAGLAVAACIVLKNQSRRSFGWILPPNSVGSTPFTYNADDATSNDDLATVALSGLAAESWLTGLREEWTDNRSKRLHGELRQRGAGWLADLIDKSGWVSNLDLCRNRSMDIMSKNWVAIEAIANKLLGDKAISFDEVQEAIAKQTS